MATAKYKDWTGRRKLNLLKEWAAKGLSDKQIAHNMDITVNTLYKWKVSHREIGEALEKGKTEIDLEVENALCKSALGFHYTEETVTNQGEIVTVKKYAKPNTAAQIFWLKNRKPVEWKDRRETEVVGKDGKDIAINIKL